jgi:hypothetical protein
MIPDELWDEIPQNAERQLQGEEDTSDYSEEEFGPYGNHRPKQKEKETAKTVIDEITELGANLGFTREWMKIERRRLREIPETEIEAVGLQRRKITALVEKEREMDKSCSNGQRTRKSSSTA